MAGVNGQEAAGSGCSLKLRREHTKDTNESIIQDQEGNFSPMPFPIHPADSPAVHGSCAELDSCPWRRDPWLKQLPKAGPITLR